MKKNKNAKNNDIENNKNDDDVIVRESTAYMG